ncbi:MAG TPA: N-acetyl-gamma-glutamyl-phosphate reductase [Phycisphaerae bacterium]|nr:N-acetyl-gamma-glutamyl-phosphate reductase [Phycisphaerae bacterium]
MSKLTVSIAGGSGYAGGEALRLLLFHPHVSVKQVSSERNAGTRVSRLHPNLRSVTDLAFCTLDDLEPCDVLLICLPHGEGIARIDAFTKLADRVIDLSADFRLNDASAYKKWYGREHGRPELLGEFVYGIPELHRGQMREAKWVSSAGCNATASILAMYPVAQAGVIEPERIVVEVKVGSSEGGQGVSPASHHPERAGCVRSFMPVGHRHTGEIVQELGGEVPIEVSMSATSIEMIRGVLATCHVFLKDDLDEKDIWKIYRSAYGHEPFVRIVKERDGIYRLPEPKLVAGTNYCDVGFVRDPHSRRLVIVSAIDNLMKGAAGQAVQALNIMCGFDERTALEFPGLHP